MLGDRGMPSDVPTGTRNPWALPGSPARVRGLPAVATYFVLWLVRRIVPASTLPGGDVCT
jgi:hypothetical protein